MERTWAPLRSDIVNKGNNTEYVISLVGDNLSVNYNGKDYLFEKGIGISETVSNKNYYISFPEDGKIPIGWGSPWIDCDKQRDLEK